jgi:hypothetical protein
VHACELRKSVSRSPFHHRSTRGCLKKLRPQPSARVARKGSPSREVHQGQSIKGSTSRAVHQGQSIKGSSSSAVHKGQSIKGSPSRAGHKGQSIKRSPSRAVHQAQSIKGSPSSAVHQGNIALQSQLQHTRHGSFLPLVHLRKHMCLTSR